MLWGSQKPLNTNKLDRPRKKKKCPKILEIQENKKQVQKASAKCGIQRLDKKKKGIQDHCTQKWWESNGLEAKFFESPLQLVCQKTKYKEQKKKERRLGRISLKSRTPVFCERCTVLLTAISCRFPIYLPISLWGISDLTWIRGRTIIFCTFLLTTFRPSPTMLTLFSITILNFNNNISIIIIINESHQYIFYFMYKFNYI